jgi:hypothetical protein
MHPEIVAITEFPSPPIARYINPGDVRFYPPHLRALSTSSIPADIAFLVILKVRFGYWSFRG